MRMVHKYGGSSVATLEKIKAIAQHIASLHRQGHELIVVCSAMGKTTNSLISMAEQVSPSPCKRELDALLSIGELQTVTLMAMTLQGLGCDAISMTGFQSGFITDSSHSRAFIKEVRTDRIERCLREGKVVVVAGFQGITEDGDITTLGRGGSDTTAVALAAALGCGCSIYTDVDAVYSVDPRLYPAAKPLKRISYEEMMEMSVCGAGVLETRCVELAKKYGVELYLGRTLEKERKGTTVMSQEKIMFEDMPITGISIKDGCTIVSFPPMEYAPGSIAAVFDLIAKSHINLDIINQNVIGGKIAFSFSCPDAQVAELRVALQNSGMLCTLNPDIRSGYTQISVVGVGMATHTGVAAKVFGVLAEAGIPYYQITTSEISISFTIDPYNKSKAIAALAKAFEL